MSTIKTIEQLSLFDEAFVETGNIFIDKSCTFTIYDNTYSFPATRYQGSKNKLTDWVWDNIKSLEFNTVLDAFGGTGSVSHMLKRKGKTVLYNDVLKFNAIIGKAIIENSSETLCENDIDFILNGKDIAHNNLIQNEFSNIFYTDEENKWLDKTIGIINSMENQYKKSLALFALFQACIAKRPYNLFHRANLYVRTSDVKRSFGNKVTWDKSFVEHFVKYANEVNNAVFDNGKVCKSMNYDVFTIEQSGFDLVYIDTPYISNKGISTDYFDFYHFLEGLSDYNNWAEQINANYKHKPLKNTKINLWNDKKTIEKDFDELFSKFKNSILVVSYRNDGIPSIDRLCQIMKKHKRNVSIAKNNDYKYVLSNRISGETLIIGV